VQKGEGESFIQGMKNRALGGTQKATQAAGGIDVNTGSNAACARQLLALA
jgi:hypothetical protein